MNTIRAGAVLLAVVTALVYAPTLGFEFVDYDDDVYVVDNEHVLQGLTPDGVRWALTTGRASNWHPLTWLSHMLDVQLYGPGPRGHHATNVVLHVVCVLLLFGFLTSATRRPGPSLVVAALFALHPINVETVAWVAQRKSLLSTALGLAACVAYVAYARRGGAGRYGLCAGFTALGLAAKPMLVTLPLLFLLLDYWPLERVRFGGSPELLSEPGAAKTVPPWRLVAEKIPLLALSVASGVTTFLVQRSGGAVGSTETLAVGPRLANAVVAYGRYLRKTIWPDDLAIAYQHPYLEGGSSLELWRILLAGTLLVTVSVAVVRSVRHRWAAVGWFWFLIAALPVIGIVQVGSQAMADRYAYVPFIGLFLVAVWGAAGLLPILRPAGLLRGSRPWWSSCSCSASPRLAPGASSGTGTTPRRCSRAVWPCRHGVPCCTSTSVRSSKPPADPTKRFGTIARLSPATPIRRARFGLANALHASGRVDEAVREYETALELDPDQAGAWYNLANTLRSLGRRQEAIAGYRRALEIDPRHGAAHNNLGTALLAEGSLAEALAQFERGVSVDATLPDLQHNLGVALVRAGRWGEALPRFRTAATLASTWPDPLISASWILAAGPVASLRDPAEAISLARRASEIRRDSPEAFDALGVALASASRFDEAVQAAATAVDLASREGRDTLAGEIRDRLALYRRGIPPVPGG